MFDGWCVVFRGRFRSDETWRNGGSEDGVQTDAWAITRRIEVNGVIPRMNVCFVILMQV